MSVRIGLFVTVVLFHVIFSWRCFLEQPWTERGEIARWEDRKKWLREEFKTFKKKYIQVCLSQGIPVRNFEKDLKLIPE